MMLTAPEEIMDTNKAFICAAASYFGLPGEQLMLGSKIETKESDTVEVVLRLALTPEDMIGIAKRMEAMREMQPDPVERAKAEQTIDRLFGEDEDTHAMRQRYNALSASEKSKWGSFGRYMMNIPLCSPANAEHLARSIEQSEGVGGRKVSHIDASEEEESHPHVDGAVWLSTAETNDAQRRHASDCRINPECAGDFQYLMQWSMLTEEQRQKAKEKP